MKRSFQTDSAISRFLSCSGRWTRKCGVFLTFLGVLLFAVHPLFHSEITPRHRADSSSSVPDHCTLCQTQHQTMPADPGMVSFQLMDAPVLPVFEFRTQLEYEEPALRAASPRAPPRTA